MRLLFATALLALGASCGYIGPPLPPALNLPRAVADLRVEEVGDNIVIRFTTPAFTTEDLPVMRLRSIELLVAPTEAGGDPASFSRDRWLAAARIYMLPVDQPGELERSVPATEWATGKEMAFAVRTTGETGRVSELSNYSFLEVLPPLTQPNVVAAIEAAGVTLSWQGNAALYRVERYVLNDPDPMPEVIGETAEPKFTDETAAYDVPYRYVVTGYTGGAIRSLPSPPVEITPVDQFAPATPAGLTAIVAGDAVELSWTRNTEPDLLGYTVLRAEEDGSFVVYAEGVALPTFTDRAVQGGKRYRYVVIAADKLGNKSAQSAEEAVRVE